MKLHTTLLKFFCLGLLAISQHSYAALEGQQIHAKYLVLGSPKNFFDPADTPSAPGLNGRQASGALSIVKEMETGSEVEFSSTGTNTSVLLDVLPNEMLRLYLSPTRLGSLSAATVRLENLVWGDQPGEIIGVDLEGGPTNSNGVSVSDFGPDFVEFSWSSGIGFSANQELEVFKATLLVTHVPEPSLYLLLAPAFASALYRRRARA